MTNRKFTTVAYPAVDDGRRTLIDCASGQDIRIGDYATTFRGEEVTVVSFRPPHKPSSSGHVTVKFANGTVMEYYAGVINAEYV